MAEGDVDAHAVYQRQDKIMHAEHAAMVQQHANEGGEGPVVLGGEHSQRLFNVAASSPGQRSCANCGIRSDKLLKCARCKAAWYCSKDCQKAQYPAHKSICKATVAGAATSSSTATQGNEKLISWKQLRNLGGQAAEDRVLKVRIMDNPLPFLRCTFQGKDHKGDVGLVAFYLDRGVNPPAGLALGRVMRWRNPHIHYFLDGNVGARIEDEDLPFITVSDS